ncbi:GCN5-related N-acetyltransferase [Rhodopseudomonas palustris HaA2]|uniref:GCN5-related N-acetyltransferase n=1 Tax=Rhodopseudomonas palustris (strain HaA2) TaxID=316058 RepID=Q2IV44_RHOP2|nr:GNAT family N-acetyltransferase [Rhodopseudomonas palustris]ABD07916.1 GCN5-related N-acetyltransferase [Rhodopseudomonas palustris HaA2]
MSMTSPRWRPMTAADLAAVNAIAAQVHVAFPEDPAIFAERLALYPAGCFVLDREPDGIGGYVVSHPWRIAEPPALDTLLGRLPAPASTYYIHDLALLPQGRGLGAGAAIVARLLRHAVAAGLSNISLVAVSGSVAFWRSQGFDVMETQALAPKLASYGADARYMVCTAETG